MSSSGPPPPQPPQASPYPPEKRAAYVPEKPGTPGPYDPSKYATIPPGFGQGEGGYLALVDEDTGEEVGVVEHVHVSGAIKPGSQEPVEVELPPVGSDGIVTIRPSEEYLRDSQHPAFVNSNLVQTAAMASRFIVTAATYAAKAMEAGAHSFTQRTKPVAQPITFTPATHNRVRKVHNFTAGVAKTSATTLGKVQHHAQNIGAKIAGKNQERGPRDKPANPGILSKGMIAVGTIADGFDHASRVLLHSSSQAATTVVGHRYGEEARDVARGITGAAKHVGLVYVDASGVSRRAIVKSVAKGMVVGKVRGGGEVIVQGDNGSQIDVIGPGGTSAAHFHPPASLQHAKTWNGQDHAPIYAPTPQAPPAYGASLGLPGHNSGYSSGRTSPVPGFQQQQHTGGSRYATPIPTAHGLGLPPQPGTPQPQQQQHQQGYPPPPGTPQHSYPGTPQPAQGYPPPPPPPPPPPQDGIVYRY